MSKDEIIRRLQDLGYRGRQVYVAKSHPDAMAKGATKADGIVADHAANMPKRDISRKYSTCLPYINRVLLQSKKGTQRKKKDAILPLDLWKSIIVVWKGIGRTGGYIYVPFALKGDPRTAESGLNGQKTALLHQEFRSGNCNAKELAERFETSVGFVYKTKSLWLKKRSR